jgi:hypothetical protein
MQTIEFRFRLPEDLAMRAHDAGVLTTDYLISMIEKELERKFYAQTFKATLDRLKNVQPPLTEADIDAEIRTYRAETAAHR